LISSISFLAILVFVLVLVSCDCWSQLHHRRVKNVKHDRRKIKKLVQQNWQKKFFVLGKEVLDSRLANGLSEFSTETEEKKKFLDEAVNSLKGVGDLGVRVKIKELVEQNWQQLLDLTKKVIDCRLADGPLEFSTDTEEKERNLFEAVKGLVDQLPATDSDHLTYLKRRLKMKAMTTSFDTRGARRLSLLCDFIIAKADYSPGCWNLTKRSCFCLFRKLPKFIKDMTAAAEGLPISKLYPFTTLVLPLILVGSDMVSDCGVLGQMWQYTLIGKLLAEAYSRNHVELNSTASANSSSSGVVAVNEGRNGVVNDITNSTVKEEKDLVHMEGVILFCLFSLSISILSVSMIILLWSNPLATLVRNARTTVMMNSRELERKNVLVPLDHLTRNNLSINESLCESSFQQLIQWIFYLFIVSSTVRREGTEAATDLTFWSLLPSSILSTISLSWGQYKAHFLTAEYSTSLAQNIVYLCACIASTVSSQILLTHLFILFLDLWHAFSAPFFFIILYWLPNQFQLLRSCIMPHILTYATDLRVYERDDFFHFGDFIQSLQLQSSKSKVNSRFVQNRSHRGLFLENLIAHITLQLLSLALICLFAFVADDYNSPMTYDFLISTFPPPSIALTGSPALVIFLIVSSILGPGLWVLSQLLLLLYFWFDNGANTCGIDFHFSDRKTKPKRDFESIIRADAPRDETYFEFKFFEELFTGFNVVSEEGRWVDPQFDDEELLQEADQEENSSPRSQESPRILQEQHSEEVEMEALLPDGSEMNGRVFNHNNRTTEVEDPRTEVEMQVIQMEDPIEVVEEPMQARSRIQILEF